MHSSVYARMQQLVLLRGIVMDTEQQRQGTYATL
jgi:hypothetical protein